MNIEQVTEYVARDGTRFKDKERCEKYEAELSAVEPIIAMLPQHDLGHGTYLPCDRYLLLAVKRRLFALVLAKYGDRYPTWKTFDADELHPRSVVGRVLDDCGRGPLSDAWATLARFDFNLGREYDQPYFVSHPNEATPAVDQ
jgi:hypothetical protein